MLAVSNPVNRRVFLENGAPWLVTLGLSPSFLRRTALAMELPRAARGKTPIVLFQRGAADALNVLVCFGDKHYYAARPQLAIATPARVGGATIAAGAIDLDGFSDCVRRWRRSSRFGTSACSRPFMPREVRVPSGRVRAVAMTAQAPCILESATPVMAINSMDEFSIRTNGGEAQRRIQTLYRTGSPDLEHGSGSDMFEAHKALRAANPQQYRPSGGVAVSALTVRAAPTADRAAGKVGRWP